MKIQKAINILLIVVLLLTGFSASTGATSANDAGGASIDQMKTFSILAGLGAESLGISEIEGNLGIAAEGVEAVGDWLVGGERHFGPGSLAGNALEEARSLSAELAQKDCDITVDSHENAQPTVFLSAGVTCFEGETVTLNEITFEHPEEEATIVIRVDGDLVLSEGSLSSLAEPTAAGSIYWAIGGSLTAGERSELTGTFLVKGNIELGTRTRVSGRLIALEGKVLVNEGQVRFEYEEPQIAEPVGPNEIVVPELTLEPTPEPTEEPPTEQTEESLEDPLANLEDGFRWKVEFSNDVLSNDEFVSSLNEYGQSDLAEGISFTSTDMTLELTGDKDISQLNSFLFDALPEVVNFLGGPIQLTVHMTSDAQPVFVYLEARNTTGFTWVFADENNDQLVQVGETKNESRGPGIGVPAIQTIELSPLSKGDLSFRFDYKRLFEPDLPIRTRLEIWIPDGVSTLEIIDPTPASFGVVSDDQNADMDVYAEQDGDINALPTSFDWRSSGIVPAVRDQGGCGSCFAFGTVGVMESAIMKSGGPNTDLSEQFIVSCNNDGWNCDYGGLTAHKYHYNVLGRSQNLIGAVLEADKPYTATNGTCTVAYNHPYKLTGWQFITGSEWTMPTVDQIKQAIYTYGPITAGVCVGGGWYSYSGGVYTSNDDCGGGTNHQIILVGWNDATQSWILRNSWGPNWGENGYMRIAYNTSRVGEGTSWVTYAPSNSTIPTPISPSGTIYLKYPTFTWTKVANATSYNVQVYTANGRVTNKIVYPSACGTTQCSAVIGPLPYVSQYFWKVNAYVGGWQPWSADKYFTRLDPIPTLVWPSGTVTVIDPLFQWNPIPGATNYNIELYNSSGLFTYKTVTTTACNSTICSTRLSNNLPTGNYYWRVKVYIEGSWSAFSAFKYFTRIMPAPTPIAPSGTIYQKYPTFTWTKIANATSYNVQVWTANGRVTNRIVYPSACGTTQCSAVIGPLQYVSQYFWRVNAYAGGWGSWSMDKYFTRLDPIPTLVWPSGAITIPNPYFQWRPLTGATSYNIELYNINGLYSTMTVSSGNCNSTVCSVKLSDFLPLGNYYWRVKSFTEGSWNAFSPFMYFVRPGFQNPGFEQGPVAWSQYSYQGYELIFQTQNAHGGSWLAWLGGLNDEIAEISQATTIASAAPYLHFWIWAESGDVCNYDSFHVGVNSTNIITMNLCEANNTNGWIEMVVNLSGYVGSNQQVFFTVLTDGSNVSSVFLDDISLTSSASASRIKPIQREAYPGAGLSK